MVNSCKHCSAMGLHCLSHKLMGHGDSRPVCCYIVTDPLVTEYIESVDV